MLGWPLHPAPHCTLQQLCLAAAWQHQHCSTAALVAAVAGLSFAPGAGTCSPVQRQPTLPTSQATNLQNLRLANLPPSPLPGTSLAPTNQKWCVRWSRVTCHVSGAGRLTPNNYSVAGAGKLSAAVWSVATARSHNVGTPRPGHITWALDIGEHQPMIDSPPCLKSQLNQFSS